MHTVSDVPDRNLLFRLAGIKTRPHGARHFTVKRGDGIGTPRKFQSQHGHAEIFVRSCRDSPVPAPSACLGKCRALAQRPQMLFHQFGVKTVVARGHGSVSREHYFARDPRHGLIKAESLVLHAAADRFQNRKSAVAFVEVKNARSDAHCPQRAEASDAQQQFLADTNAPSPP